MHGDIRVARVSLDPQGRFRSIEEIADAGHMPPGTLRDSPAPEGLNRWWSARAIPASRWGQYRDLRKLRDETPESLMVRTMGLSLTDSYWLAPADEIQDWSDVNFHSNCFSDYLGVLFFDGVGTGDVSFDSPDAALNGNLRKRWMIVDGRRFLMKGGSGIVRQEPFNEVIASRLMSRLGIPHIEYCIEMHGREPCCRCPCFSDADREFVPSGDVMRSCSRREGETLFDFTVRAHERFGIEDPRGFLERMIVVDYLMANEDRHFGNFGVMRDPETLKPLGFAPVFDTGASLGFNQPTVWIEEGYDLRCMPFKIAHKEQIGLVSSFDWLDLDKLAEFGDEVREILGVEGFPIDDSRSDAIVGYLERRISSIAGFIDSGTYPVDDSRTDLVLTG